MITASSLEVPHGCLGKYGEHGWTDYQAKKRVKGVVKTQRAHMERVTEFLQLVVWISDGCLVFGKRWIVSHGCAMPLALQVTIGRGSVATNLRGLSTESEENIWSVPVSFTPGKNLRSFRCLALESLSGCHQSQTYLCGSKYYPPNSSSESDKVSIRRTESSIRSGAM